MPISFAEIVNGDLSVTAAEAALLVDAALERAARLDAPTLPPRDCIWLSESGTVDLRWRGDEPVAAEPVLAAATLLAALLRLDDGARNPVPGGLLVMLARVRGRIDLPPPTLADLRRVLRRTAGDASLAAVYARAARVDAAPAYAAPAYVASHPSGDATFATSHQAPLPITKRQLWLVPSATFAAGVALTLVVSSLDWWRAGSSTDVPPTAITTSRTAVPVEPAVSELASTPARVASAAPARVPVTSPGRAVATDAASSASSVAPARASDDEPLVSPLLPAALQAGEAFSPAYGADGELLYHVGRSTASLMKATLGAHRPALVTTLLRDGAANYHAALSPDGNRLAFDSDRDGVRAVYVSGSDARAARRVSGEGYAAVPSWSPDGTRLAFVKAEPMRRSVWNVWVADLRTGSLTRVSNHRVGQAWRPSWFPDGQRVAYSVEDRLVVADLGGAPALVVRSPLRGKMLRTPAVSPDGEKIVFQVHGDGVWLMNVRTRAMRRLLADRTAEEFTWAPDGGRVAYHARRDGRWSLWQLSL